MDAPSRLSASRGWVRTDGAPFADSPSSLMTGELVFPARLDEYGSDLGDQVVFTGTEGGVKTVETCADWTSADNQLNGSVNEVKLAFDLPRSWGLGCGTRRTCCASRSGASSP